MALASHIRTAQTEGPKAGFTAYMEHLERSGLPTVQEKLATIKAAGNKKAQFEAYCAMFGKHFGTTPQKSDEFEALKAQLAEVTAALGALQAGGTGVQVVEDEDTSLDEIEDVPTPTRSTPRSATTTNGAVSDKVNLWRPWAVKRFNIPRKVGSTFTYQSKRAGQDTTHQVVRVTTQGVYAKRIA